MSPTERDLRAALSDGEGSGPDPDRLIALGRARQARRRVQLISTAAVVAVVAGGGAGIVTLVRGGGGDSKSSNGAAARGSAQDVRGAAGTQAAPAVNSAAAGAAKAATRPSPARPRCRITRCRVAAARDSSEPTNRCSASRWSRWSSVPTRCRRAPTGAGPRSPHRTSLTGARAARLAASLNEATAKPAALCPRRDVSATARNYAIIGVAADGAALPTVTVTRSASACADSQVTNGTAVRYNWTPPSDLLPVLGTPTSPPKMHGSPISS